MWRRLNREDLSGVSSLRLETREDNRFTWYVYECYEGVEQDGCISLRATDSNKAKFAYKPFEETPHLFLEFARLVEQEDLPAALTEWIFRRGLLGLHRREQGREKGPGSAFSFTGYNSEDWRTQDLQPSEYRHEGGSSESVDRYEEGALKANIVLTNWEAFLSKEPQKAEQTFLHTFRPKPSEEVQNFLSLIKAHSENIGLTYNEYLLFQAGDIARRIVQDHLEAFAYPFIAFDYPDPHERSISAPGPALVAGSWRPRNLLGAMYLQMYQVMISSGSLSPCKYCHRTLSLAPPISDGSTARKPRKDKDFCNSRCRQNYHYHNKIKSARRNKEP